MKGRLRLAYELIKDERHWTQHVSARDEFGDAIGSLQPDAVRWCAAGAVQKFQAYAESWALLEAARELFPQYGDELQYNAVLAVNDYEGHDAIVQVFEKALVALEGSL